MPNFYRSALFACAKLISCTLVFSVAAASLDYRHFDLPGQPLQTSIIEFATQAGVTIMVDHDLLRSHHSPSIIGPYTSAQALDRLLARAPLTYVFRPESSAYIIVPATPVPAAPPKITTPEPTQTIQEVVVYAPSHPFRYNTIGHSHQQHNSSIYDPSRVHTILESTIIEDHAPSDLADLLKFGSGITPGDGMADSNDDFHMRGFPRHALYVDGFRVEKTTGVKFFADNIERVEILKGPSTLKFGQGEPGGVVNLVRKKPQETPHRHLTLATGSHNFQKIAGDVTDTLPSENFLYRINGVAMQQNRAGDATDIQRYMLTPSLRWTPNQNTFFDVSYEYQFAKMTFGKDFLALAPVPEEDFNGAYLRDLVRQRSPDFTTDFHLFETSGTHFLAGGNWRLHGQFFWQEESREGVRTDADQLRQSQLFFDPEELGKDYFLLIPGGQVALPIIYRTNPRDPLDPIFSIGTVRSIYDEQTGETGLHSALSLDGTTVWLDTTHHLNFGMDWRRQDIFQSFTVESRNPFPFENWTDSTSPSLSYLFDEIFSPSRALGDLSFKEQRRVHDEYGLFFQDTIEIHERINITAGSRYTVTNAHHENLTAGTEHAFDRVKKFRSQLGVSFDAHDNINLFGSYSEGLRANYATGDLEVSSSQPELSQQWEGGVKAHLVDGRMLTTLAFYSIDKTGIWEMDTYLVPAFTLNEMGQFVRGMDLDLTYQISSDTNLIGSLSVLDPVISYGNFKDNTPAAAAHSTASFFVYHDVNAQFAVSTAAHYVGRRYADNANQFEIKPFYTLDCGAVYQFHLNGRKSRFQLNIKNVLDREYYSAVVAAVRLNKAEGRQVVGTFSVEL